MKPILFHLGSWPIWAYGASLTVAFIFGAWFGARRARRIGIDGDHVWNAATWAFVSALLGARLLHILFENRALLSTPTHWLSVWQGGLVFYGGFLGALASSVIYCRAKKLDFWTMADILAPVVALGHGIVRLGCFMNGCCYGKPASWGVVFPSLQDGVHRQPTQLYEAAAGAAFFVGLLAWERRGQRAKGEIVLLYAAAYGAARFLIEFARADDRGGTFLGLTLSQHIGLAALVAGLVGFVLRRRAPTPAVPAG